MSSTATDQRWMQLALSLGRRGAGLTWPNPAVGCVLVHSGRVVGRGSTQAGGRPHAETIALAQAGDKARGATAYVTLEPCSHHGKTPPCATALRDAGVTRVVSALEDPDPRVAGQGHATLRNAGVAVDVDVLRSAAEADHAGYLLKTTAGRPQITLKLACTVDGRIATQSGESQWITGAAARRQVHLMRAQHDAVMVGAGTVAADNPSLTVRDIATDHQPVRVIIDSRVRSDPKNVLGQSAVDVPVWICHTADAPAVNVKAWTAAGAKMMCMPGPLSGQVALSDAMACLAEAGLTRVLCEGGGILGSALLDADLVDRFVVFYAGKVLGSNGLPCIGPMAFDTLDDAPGFELSEVRQIGMDTMQVWQRP